jgi:RNA polymerase sigma-70 factor (ECF subfamily)
LVAHSLGRSVAPSSILVGGPRRTAIPAESPPPPPSDEELVAAANGGDAGAFEQLYERHREWVVRLALRFCPDHGLALDVMQETFLYLLGLFPGFELRARMRTFLYPVVRHRALAAWSRARRERAVSLRGSSGEDASSEPRDPVAEGLGQLLAELPVGQREVLLLRFVDGLALGEIARALEVPVGTVKSRLHLALRALREDPRTRNLL